MKCIDWTDVRWAVVKEDGNFAGVPCASYGEARDLAACMMMISTRFFSGSCPFCWGLDFSVSCLESRSVCFAGMVSS